MPFFLLFKHFFISRIPLPEDYLNMVVGRLRSDDIYHQLRCYPDPRHRSVGLADQAAMLYICLFFTPNVLKNDAAAMREIVDKFFPDNWVRESHKYLINTKKVIVFMIFFPHPLGYRLLHGKCG